MTKNNKEREHLGSILCLGGSQESLPIIHQIINMGYRPIVLDQDEHCAANEWNIATTPPPVFHQIGDNIRDEMIFIKADCYGFLSCRTALDWAENKEFWKYDGGFFNLNDLVGVLCCAVDSPLVAAQLAERYHLPTIGIEAAKLGVNKYYQWRRLSEAGIVVPPSAVVSPETNWRGGVEYYDIVKPVDSRGARGVRFYDQTNYKEAISESLAWSRSAMVMGQKFIPGRQLSTESVVYDGQVCMTAVFDRNYDRLEEFRPYIVEDGGEMRQPDKLIKQINKTIERSCIALGWDNLTVKGDLVLDGHLLYAIELAPRLSGGYFSTHSIPIGMGWDIVGDAVRLATGAKPTLEFGREGVYPFTCQRYIFPNRKYVGKRISYIPDFPPDVNFGTWNVRVGDVIQKVQHHPSRLGQVICTGDKYEEAVAKAMIAVKELTEGITLE